MPPKLTPAATKSRAASGQIDCWWVTITWSMICRCSRGIAAVATVATRAPPSEISTLRRCRQQYSASRRSHPRSEVPVPLACPVLPDSKTAHLAARLREDVNSPCRRFISQTNHRTGGQDRAVRDQARGQLYPSPGVRDGG